MARILVVDDSIENLTLIELYLRGSEFEVVTASGGHEAVELCLHESFELILLDVVMPKMDGFEVCRRLKNDPRTAFVPVIFLTGRLVDESDKVAAYQLGAVDYIQKPVNREELVARVRVMLRLEQARSRLDRENVQLRDQVEALGQKMQAASQQIDGLQRLRQEFGAGAEPAFLMLDGELRVTTVDSVAAALLGKVAPGMLLVEAGHAAARVARLVADGARSADIALPQSDGSTRTVHVDVREREGFDGSCVLLRDVTGIRIAERVVRDRELAQAPLRGPGAASMRKSRSYTMTEFIGNAASLDELIDSVDRLRQTRSTVLIHGESGTGKELVARALHFDGGNRNAPFIPLHCGAIAPELVESELFGHEKGAFTGAQQSRDGLFRAADGGTIFLDEVAEMSLAVQVKLLRVLQRGEIRPVGANQPRIVDVRIIAATNKDLARMVRQGTFREDLFYRLQVVRLDLPPLRERIDDLPMLVDYFVRLGNTRHDRSSRPVRGVSRSAMELMLIYSWPGNIRELENVIERAFALGVGDVLQEEDLPSSLVRGQSELAVRTESPQGTTMATGDRAAKDTAALPDLRSLRRTAERQAILQALTLCGGDKIAAAHTLGLSRSTFYRRLRQHGL